MKIRKISINDAEGMLHLNQQLDEESDFMLFEPGEREQAVEAQARNIEGALIQNSVIWLVAEAEDKSLQGYCVVSIKPQRRIRHVGSLVIGIAKTYWNQGIGFRLISSMIEHAETHGLTRLELSVRSDNARTIALYKKAGFVIEGKRKNSIRIGSEYFDEIYMARV